MLDAALHDGVVVGAFFKADIDQGLHLARLLCETAPEAYADLCEYVRRSDLALIETFLLWDLDFPGCARATNVYDPEDPLVVVGHEPNCQAVSVCAFWSAEKARLEGAFPAAGP